MLGSSMKKLGGGSPMTPATSRKVYTPKKVSKNDMLERIRTDMRDGAIYNVEREKISGGGREKGKLVIGKSALSFVLLQEGALDVPVVQFAHPFQMITSYGIVGDFLEYSIPQSMLSKTLVTYKYRVLDVEGEVQLVPITDRLQVELDTIFVRYLKIEREAQKEEPAYMEEQLKKGPLISLKHSAVSSSHRMSTHSSSQQYIRGMRFPSMYVMQSVEDSKEVSEPTSVVLIVSPKGLCVMDPKRRELRAFNLADIPSWGVSGKGFSFRSTATDQSAEQVTHVIKNRQADAIQQLVSENAKIRASGVKVDPFPTTYPPTKSIFDIKK